MEKIKEDFIQKELFIAKGFTSNLINTLSTEKTFYQVLTDVYVYICMYMYKFMYVLVHIHI
jgi:hypothetical protein